MVQKLEPFKSWKLGHEKANVSKKFQPYLQFKICKKRRKQGYHGKNQIEKSVFKEEGFRGKN